MLLYKGSLKSMQKLWALKCATIIVCLNSIPYKTHPPSPGAACLDTGTSGVAIGATSREATTTTCLPGPRPRGNYTQRSEVTSTLTAHPYTLLCAFKHHEVVLLGKCAHPLHSSAPIGQCQVNLDVCLHLSENTTPQGLKND